MSRGARSRWVTPGPNRSPRRPAPGPDQVERVLALEPVFGRKIPACPAFVDAFRRQLERLQTLGVRRTLALTLAE